MAHKKPLTEEQEDMLVKIKFLHMYHKEAIDKMDELDKEIKELKDKKKEWGKVRLTAKRSKIMRIEQAIEKGVPQNQIANTLKMRPQALQSIIKSCKFNYKGV